MNDPSRKQCRHRSFNRLLVAVESGLGLRALACYAMRFAAPDMQLKLVSIACNPRVMFPALKLSHADWSDARCAVIRAGEAALSDAKRHIEGLGLTTEMELLDLSLRGDTAAVALGHAAHEWGASLVVFAAHPRGQGGHCACQLDPEEVAVLVPAPVLYVPGNSVASGLTEPARILVAVDAGETAEQALCAAIMMVPKTAELRVVYVVHRALQAYQWWAHGIFKRDSFHALESAEALLRKSGRAGTMALIHTATEADDVSASIAREARQWSADLIVIGSRGRRATTRWPLGSVAGRTLRRAPCPVLICPPLGEVSSVVEHPSASDAQAGEDLRTQADASPLFL